MTNNNDNDCLQCIGLCCGCITALGIVAGTVAYYVFGIMYLVQDYNISHDCSHSSLWAYVLTAVILSFTRASAKNANDDNTDTGTKICSLVCLGLIETGLAIWGGIELWDKSCDNLINTNIWKFGLATFCIQTFVGAIFLIIIPGILMCMLCCNANNTDDVSNDNSFQNDISV
jgi:hypothetical protein